MSLIYTIMGIMIRSNLLDSIVTKYTLLFWVWEWRGIGTYCPVIFIGNIMSPHRIQEKGTTKNKVILNKLVPAFFTLGMCDIIEL